MHAHEHDTYRVYLVGVAIHTAGLFVDDLPQRRLHKLQRAGLPPECTPELLVHLTQVLEVICGVVEVGVDTDLQRKTLYETERNANANIPSRRALA